MLGSYNEAQLARAARLHRNSPIMTKYINAEVKHRANPTKKPRTNGPRPL